MGSEQGQAPYEGTEGQPPAQVPPPQRYGSTPEQPSQDVAATQAGPPVPGSAVPGSAVPGSAGEVARSGPSNADRLVAISGPVSFIGFMGAGFALDGWSWSWLFLMLPGLAYTWRNAGKDD